MLKRIRQQVAALTQLLWPSGNSKKNEGAASVISGADNWAAIRPSGSIKYEKNAVRAPITAAETHFAFTSWCNIVAACILAAFSFLKAERAK